MSMNKSTYIGPYVRCYNPCSGDPVAWVIDRIDRSWSGRLRHANGESIVESPALFAPNVRYDGCPDFFGEFEDGGEMEIPMKSACNYVRRFDDAFKDEIAVLRDYFERIEIIFGVIVTWS